MSNTTRRKPAHIRALEGKSIRDVPKPRPVFLDDPPPHLTEEAALIWSETTEALEGCIVLTAADVVALEAYSTAVDQLRKAQALLDSEGLVISDERGSKKKHPACQIARDAKAEVLRWSEQLGLSPKARQTMDAIMSPNNNEEEWADLFT